MNTFNKIKTMMLMGLIALSGITIRHETSTPVLAEDTADIYLQTSENWRTHDAQFAAYVWIFPDISPRWLPMSPLSADPSEEKYHALVPTTYNRILFVRMSVHADPLNYTWERKEEDVWNQTSDLILDFTTGDNLYVIDEGKWGEGEEIGYWSQYLPTVIDPEPDEDPDDPNKSTIEPAVFRLHYYRNDGRAGEYQLWLWGEGESGSRQAFNDKKTIKGKEWRTVQVASTHFSKKEHLNLIVHRFQAPNTWLEQTPDIKIKIVEFPRYEADGTYYRDFFLVDMETTVYKTADEAVGPKILDARFIIASGEKPTAIAVKTFFAPAQYAFVIDNVVERQEAASATKDGNFYTFTIPLNPTLDIDIRKQYSVRTTFVNTPEYQDITRERYVSFDAIFNSQFFEDNFTYNGEDLGVTYTPSATTFKVWAPTSRAIKVNIYEYGTPTGVDKVYNFEQYDEIYETITLDYTEKGVWAKTVTGDYHGKYYTLVADNANGVEEFTDPYAKAAGINGIRGMIVDFSKTNPEGWDDVSFSVKQPTEIVPYELHVADLTHDSSWNGSQTRRRKYLGLIQEGTMYKDPNTGRALKTGFDHILELGVNAVQILPFYDQDNDETNAIEFNWGYNPQNYNVLEGKYSSNPHNGIARINEFKQVVQKYAEHDIRIIMDVVYNHVSSISQHSFTKLVPGYYFRYYENGAPNNSSGVGNVTATERIMMENFMRDSTAFWAEEYKLGGFRFDLMGLHTVKSMNTVAAKLKTIREDIVLYGEPWDMHDHTGLPGLGDFATQGNINKMPGVGAFNDQGRNAIKGGSWDVDAHKGWVQESGHEVDKIIDGTMGKITGGTTNPSQVVNYISVHDNYTIYDHLRVASKDTPIATIKKQALQAEALSMLSQGVGFMHAGSEMLRSKPKVDSQTGYDHNSYKSSYGINAIKWAEKGPNLNHYNAYRRMVALKKNAPAFNYATRALVDANSGTTKIAANLIKLNYSAGEDHYELYHYGASNTNANVSINNMEVMLDTSGSQSVGAKINGTLSLTPNTSVVLRNIRSRTNDLTVVNNVNYETFIEPTHPVDTEWETPLPPGVELPEVPTPGPGAEDETPRNIVPIVLIASGSSLLALGGGVGAFFLIRKRRRRLV